MECRKVQLLSNCQWWLKLLVEIFTTVSQNDQPNIDNPPLCISQTSNARVSYCLYFFSSLPPHYPNWLRKSHSLCLFFHPQRNFPWFEYKHREGLWCLVVLRWLKFSLHPRLDRTKRPVTETIVELEKKMISLLRFLRCSKRVNRKVVCLITVMLMCSLPS